MMTSIRRNDIKTKNTDKIELKNGIVRIKNKAGLMPFSRKEMTGFQTQINTKIIFSFIRTALDLDPDLYIFAFSS